MILRSLASESSVPSSGQLAAALSFPNFSRLSAVRELASSSCGGGHSTGDCRSGLWGALLGAPLGGEGRGEEAGGEGRNVEGRGGGNGSQAWSARKGLSNAQVLTEHHLRIPLAEEAPPMPLGYSEGPEP